MSQPRHKGLQTIEQRQRSMAYEASKVNGVLVTISQYTVHMICATGRVPVFLTYMVPVSSALSFPGLVASAVVAI